MKRTLVCLLLISLAAARAWAGGKLELRPIDADDWAVAAPADCPVQDAVMIFEEVTNDDTQIHHDIQRYTLYRRIRILGPEGVAQAEGTIPQLRKQQKLEAFVARTTLRDGREFKLDKGDLRKHEVVRSHDLTIEEQCFSLQGVTTDCIIDYAFRIRIKSSFPVPPPWEIQKEIPLLRNRYTWRLGPYLHGFTVAIGTKTRPLRPNYVLRNCADWVRVERHPDSGDPRELLFTATNLPPYVAEPFSFEKRMVSANAFFYYGDDRSTHGFWDRQAEKSTRWIHAFFTRDSKRLDQVKAELPREGSREERVCAAYNWVRAHIRRVEQPKKASKRNRSCEMMLQRGCGTTHERQALLWELLRSLDLPAHLAFGLPRDQGVFVRDLKIWQFTTDLVALERDDGGFDFYSLEFDSYPCGQLPWTLEGTTALLVGAVKQRLVTIPFSAPRANTHRRTLSVAIDSEGHCRGHCSDRWSGQEYWAIRDTLGVTTDEEPLAASLSNLLQRVLLADAVDSLRIEKASSDPPLLATRATLDLGNRGEELGARLLLRPLSWTGFREPRLTAAHRVTPIVFDFANVRTEIIQLQLPQNLEIEALPADTSVVNRVGSCQMIARRVGNAVSLQRCLRLRRAFWPQSAYPDLQALYSEFQRLSDAPIVLRESS